MEYNNFITRLENSLKERRAVARNKQRINTSLGKLNDIKTKKNNGQNITENLNAFIKNHKQFESIHNNWTRRELGLAMRMQNIKRGLFESLPANVSKLGGREKAARTLFMYRRSRAPANINQFLNNMGSGKLTKRPNSNMKVYNSHKFTVFINPVNQQASMGERATMLKTATNENNRIKPLSQKTLAKPPRCKKIGKTLFCAALLAGAGLGLHNYSHGFPVSKGLVQKGRNFVTPQLIAPPAPNNKRVHALIAPPAPLVSRAPVSISPNFIEELNKIKNKRERALKIHEIKNLTNAYISLNNKTLNNLTRLHNQLETNYKKQKEELRKLSPSALTNLGPNPKLEAIENKLKTKTSFKNAYAKKLTNLGILTNTNKMSFDNIEKKAIELYQKLDNAKEQLKTMVNANRKKRMFREFNSLPKNETYLTNERLTNKLLLQFLNEQNLSNRKKNIIKAFKNKP